MALLYSPRMLRSVLVPLLAVAAVFGYLIGVHHTASSSSSGRAVGRPQIASGHSVILEYPATWRASAQPVRVPSLPIKEPLALVPNADPGRAGLVSGRLSVASEPLPVGFVSRLATTPKTEVLDLLDVQAYKYSPIQLKGDRRAMVIYVVPTAGSDAIALVCYAESPDSPFLAQCGEIVSSMSLVGQPAAELRPDSGYAHRIETYVARLEGDRVALRKRLGDGVTLQGIGLLTDRLAGYFDDARASIAKLEAPLASAAAQTVLLHALERARDIYRELASAARSDDLVRYEDATRSVEAAEREVDVALETYSLLGYGRR